MIKNILFLLSCIVAVGVMGCNSDSKFDQNSTIDHNLSQNSTNPNRDHLIKVSDTIAYLSHKRTKINIIKDDGSNQQEIWSAPKNSLITTSIGSLSWRLDGSELAFDSDHEFGSSVYGRDIYVVASDGSYLRKITNSPNKENLKNLPKGGAKIRSQNWLGGGANFWAYIEGSLTNHT